MVAPVLISEADQPSFFGKTTFSALRISCTQAFSLIGSRAMISEPAAITMAIAARVVGSITNRDAALSVAVLDKKATARKGFYRYISVSHC